MYLSLYREYHWTPYVIGNLFVDDMDHEGLVKIFDDLRRSNEEVKKAYKK